MVLTTLTRRLAAAAVAGLAGCAWLEEKAPTGVSLKPTDYEPRLAEPYDYPDNLAVGMSTPLTREISAFLGTERFRAALTLEDEATGTSWIAVMNPGLPDSLPRFSSYPNMGPFRFVDAPMRIETCRLSPDGNAMVYSLSPARSWWQPRNQWMQTLSGRDWLVPLASKANRSLGMLGQNPYWHVEDGRQVILFDGIGSLDGLGGVTVQETRKVERLSDSSVSPVEPFRMEGGILNKSLSGISRGNKWVLLSKHGDLFLVPGNRVQDSGYLASPDSLRTAKVGGSAALNPFDPSQTTHADYYATLPFSVFSEKMEVDSSLAPKGLDGKPGNHPDHSASIWICDKDRNIILSQRLPGWEDSSPRWIHWTNHPNFIVVGQGGWVYLVKLAGDTRTLLSNPEAATLQAEGVFRLSYHRREGILDASVWIGEGP